GARPWVLPAAVLAAAGSHGRGAAHDLVEALRPAPAGGGAHGLIGPEADAKTAPAEQLAQAVRRVREAAQSEAMTRSARM
ncbi:hypothetical protein ACFXO2_35840, partial [Streptomyces sp. NPDC059152]